MSIHPFVGRSVAEDTDMRMRRLINRLGGPTAETRALLALLNKDWDGYKQAMAEARQGKSAANESVVEEGDTAVPAGDQPTP